MIELYDILTLEDDLDYVVIGITSLNNESYYLLNRIDEEEELIDEPIIAKKTTIDGEDALKPITNDSEYNEVKDLFAKQLFNEE